LAWEDFRDFRVSRIWENVFLNCWRIYSFSAYTYEVNYDRYSICWMCGDSENCPPFYFARNICEFIYFFIYKQYTRHTRATLLARTHGVNIHNRCISCWWRFSQNFPPKYISRARNIRIHFHEFRYSVLQHEKVQHKSAHMRQTHGSARLWIANLFL